ncbi:MAG: hypothetical protein V7L22_23025 [Nostoc sp.]|uniref:hypothetical protein n=1 Tax=Nostoc sp. TaxID=1180 RepID=UPI002FF837AA
MLQIRAGTILEVLEYLVYNTKLVVLADAHLDDLTIEFFTSMRSLLEEMGNTIVPLGNGSDEGTSRWMKAAGIAINEEHYRKVANAKDIDRRTYTSRQHQNYLKPEEVLECEKFRIQDTYGMSVTPELVEKDDGRRLIKKIVALEAILSAPGEMITDEQGREFIPPATIVVEWDKGERERLAICTLLEQSFYRVVDASSTGTESGADGSDGWG